MAGKSPGCGLRPYPGYDTTQPKSSRNQVPFSEGGAPTGAGIWRRMLGAQSLRSQRWGLSCARAGKEVAEPADKPGSVVDSHSSRRIVTDTLKQPTRTRRGPRHEVPIWSCSRWGLPCRPVARLAVRSYRTISPLPRLQPRPCGHCRSVRRYLSVALSVSLRRPGVTWHRALWSPDFPRHRLLDDATVWPTPPWALSHATSSAVQSPPYRAFRGAPDNSAASLAAVEGGKYFASVA